MILDVEKCADLYHILSEMWDKNSSTLSVTRTLPFPTRENTLLSKESAADILRHPEDAPIIRRYICASMYRAISFQNFICGRTTTKLIVAKRSTA